MLLCFQRRKEKKMFELSNFLKIMLNIQAFVGVLNASKVVVM
jgi:hypothetical protein